MRGWQVGILGRLFGRQGTDTPPSAPKPDEGAGAPAAAAAPELAWIGEKLYEVSHSANRQFALGWSDASPDGIVTGSRGAGKGSWILLEAGRERSRGRLERPNDGKVANNGRFVLADWLFTDRLAAAFYAFDPDGTVLIAEQLGANIGQTAVAAHGRLAVVETYENPGNPEWSNLLMAYDLDRRTRLWATTGPGAARAIEVEIDRVVLHLRSGRVRTVHLADGSPGEAWIESDDPFTDLRELEVEMNAEVATAGPDQIESWLNRSKAAADSFGEYANWRAKALRMQGEALEQLGRDSEAITAYSAGMALDPNLGVRRRLKALGAEVEAAPKHESAEPVVDERPYASTACPSCTAQLSPLPKSKTKCRSCGNRIWVRGAPDGMRHLLREDQLEAHQASWDAWHLQRARDEELAPERQRESDATAGLIVGLYEPEVVGESHYQAVLRQHATEIGVAGGEQSVIVALVREPNNAHDRNAVSVRLGGKTVGYISSDEAELVGTMLRSLERGEPRRARATIRGGYERAPSLGISLDGIPDAYELLGR